MANYVLTPSAVRKLRGVLAATPGNSGATGAASPISIDNFPLPFTVRWSASASDSGAWVIWLPDPAQLVMLDGAYTTIGGITAATSLPAGWYTIDGSLESSDEIWLSITISKSDSGEIVSVSADLSAAEKQAATGDTVYNIVVAEMITATDTGAKRVKQFIDSAVILGGTSRSGEGEGEGGEGGDTPGEDPTVEIVGDIMYDISDHQLKKRIDTVNLKTGAVVKGNYVMIVGGQATPHTGEIS